MNGSINIASHAWSRPAVRLPKMRVSGRGAEETAWDSSLACQSSGQRLRPPFCEPCFTEKEHYTAMTRIRLITMALFAVLCVSAVSASGAFATVKKAEIVNSSGGALTGSAFTGSSGETVLETTSGANVKCKKSTATGEITGIRTATQTVTFSECKNSLGQKCKTEGGSVEEQIKIEGVKETVAFKEAAKEKLVLTSEINGTFKFLCSTVKNEARGLFIVAVGKEQEEVLKKSYAFEGKASSKGVMEIQSAVSSTGATITSSLESKLLTAAEPFKQSSQVGTESVTLTSTEGKFV